MTDQPYQFRAEWIAEVLDRVMGRSVEDEDLEVNIREELGMEEPEDYGQVIVVERDELQSVADQIAANLLEEADRERTRRAQLIASANKHEGCERIIEDLLRERDDLIAGVQQARSTCFNDITLGEYGDLYVATDDVLHALRPRKTTTRAGRSRDEFEVECDGCGQSWVHDDDCPVAQFADSLKEQAGHEQASHRHCGEIVHELLAQIDAQREHVETIADLVRSQSEHVHEEGTVLDPHDVLHLLAGTQPCQGVQVSSHSARIYPPLASVPYCDSERYDHTEPHRACRYLVS